MFNNWLARLAFSVIACAGAGQSALLPIGSISFNQIGDSGEFGEFRVYNRTATPGYPVQTPVTFVDASLRVDILGGLSNQLIQIADLMPAQGAAYDSDDIYKSVNMTRAVFRATLSPGSAWQIAGVGTFAPQDPHLTMILLPNTGATITRGSMWDILMNTSDNLIVPEPSTMLLAGAGILGLGLLRRRRTS
jgi:hypothetical protein